MSRLWLSCFLLASAPAFAADPFYWGVGHSAFQVEGSPVESDWTRWTRIPGKIADGSNADRATDFWKRYEEDFDLAKTLGANAFRLSIAWERLEPKKGAWDEDALTHYEKIVLAARARGLEPVVTLHHFVLPAWLVDEGGLESKDFPGLFAAYADRVVRRLSNSPASVKWWVTINEPMVLTHAGYLTGEWPPGRTNDARGAMRAAANMARAHLETVRRARTLGNAALKFSVAAHYRVFQPKTDRIWHRAAAKLSNWAFNWQFLEAVHTGKLRFWMPGSEFIRETIPLPDGRSSLDYVGLNYYGRMITELGFDAPFVKVSEGPGPKNDLGWEMYPEGLSIALKELHDGLGLPIFVTENGVADALDDKRPNFVANHVAALKYAQSEGVNVVGYLHWSLTDNFEWAKGLVSRFGLVEVDYATLEKKPRASFETYRKIIEESRE